MKENLICNFEDKHQDYLRDESKLTGYASSISFPKSEEEVISIIKKIRAEDVPITIQGAKTGIVGGAIPEGGHLLNLSEMNRVKRFEISDTGIPILTVEAGITLSELETEISRLGDKVLLFWPPDPTEKTATVGGAAACGARGSCAYFYGNLNDYIEAFRIIDFEGTVHEIRRGKKAIAFLGEQMDLFDLYLGSEGFYGIITEISLRLIPKPQEMWGIVFFFSQNSDCYRFAEEVRRYENEDKGGAIAAIEFMDRNTIELLQKYKKNMSGIKELPDLEEDISALIYVEIHGDKEEIIEEIADYLLELAIHCNSDPEQSWALIGETEIKKVRAFRHAAPEVVNLIVEKAHQQDSRITKLSTDMVVKGKSFRAVVTNYQEDLKKAGLNGCIFGHVGANHLHVNILPENFTEYEKGKEILDNWAEKTIKAGGSLITEHGIGKLKKEMFLKYSDPMVIGEIKKIKEILDPSFMWNRGNILNLERN